MNNKAFSGIKYLIFLGIILTIVLAGWMANIYVKNKNPYYRTKVQNLSVENAKNPLKKFYDYYKGIKPTNRPFKEIHYNFQYCSQWKPESPYEIPEWTAIRKLYELKEYEEVTRLIDELVLVHRQKARDIQSSLPERPWKTRKEVFTYWPLNLVGSAFVLQGHAYMQQGSLEKAQEAYRKVTDQYPYAQCYMIAPPMFARFNYTFVSADYVAQKFLNNIKE